ncbi:MAG: hypothetical protein U0Q12_11570 [Vicinamibacterales bacterium]
MSDRKYRQRGYQDEPREERPKPQGAPQRSESHGPKTPNLMGFRESARCSRCGHQVRDTIQAESTCPKCGTDLHSCQQCVSFDPGSRFECAQPIKARIAPKDRRNACPSFEPKVTVEKETHSTGGHDARKAFDDLFKL